MSICTANRLWALCLLAGLCMGNAAQAQQARDGEWGKLTPAQRSVLAPLKDNWGSFGAEQRRRWLEFAGRYPRMSEDEQRRVQERMADWSQTTPQQRGRARAQFEASRRVDPNERQSRWEAYQALPPEQRQKLAEQADPPRIRGEQRRGAGARSEDGPDLKSNIVRTPRAPSDPRPVAPTVVQPGPGATTSLMGQPASPPLHQQPGLPKMTATPGFVDRNTLLPRRGPQGAGARPLQPPPDNNDRR
jgi:Protein of unknown function (DUF3106)